MIAAGPASAQHHAHDPSDLAQLIRQPAKPSGIIHRVTLSSPDRQRPKVRERRDRPGRPARRKPGAVAVSSTALRVFVVGGARPGYRTPLEVGPIHRRFRARSPLARSTDVGPGNRCECIRAPRVRRCPVRRDWPGRVEWSSEGPGGRATGGVRLSFRSDVDQAVYRNMHGRLLIAGGCGGGCGSRWHRSALLGRPAHHTGAEGLNSSGAICADRLTVSGHAQFWWMVPEFPLCWSIDHTAHAISYCCLGTDPPVR